jgi:hypothetical protein
MRNVKTAGIIALPVILLAFVYGVFFFFSPARSGSAPAAPGPPPVQSIPPAGQPAATPATPFSSLSLRPEAEPARYIFSQLTPSQQTVYERFRVALQRMDSGILVSQAEAREIAPFELIDLYYAVICDYPEIFWSDNYIYTASVTRAGEPYLSVTFTFTMSAAERGSAQEKIDAAAAACLDGLPAGAADFEKILYVYEYIIRTTAYDAAALYNQDIVSVFLYGRSVCMGYTKATQYLLQRLGFTCATVSGNATGIGLHAWNLVQADGDYYYLDTTWGDPDLARNSYASYDYFLVTSRDMAATHRPSVDFTLPDCTATRLNYFQVMNRQFDRYNRSEVSRAMREDLTASGQTAVRFSTDDEYKRAIADLFSNKTIFKITADSQISYFLTDELRIITVLER